MKADWSYYAFKWYIKLVHDTMLLRKRYVYGLDNVPADGERYFIVSNHQNTGNDPLNILFALPFRIKMCAMARANVFELKPWITRFLTWVGMVPAFRMGFEGVNGVESNFSSFNKVAERLNEGYPFVVFPQAGHTQGQYVGRFTSGTVRLAFQAAEQNGWQEDVKILPTALHYSDYFDVQTDIIWKVAPAVSLKPYYEEFQQHPSSVMRRLTHQIHDTVQQMMLDEGEQDHETKDFLRLSTLNIGHRESLTLPERLEIDQAFCRRLNSHEQYDEIIASARSLQQMLTDIGTTEPIMMAATSAIGALCTVLMLLVLLPLWIVCLWPHGLCYSLPMLMLRTDRMFTNTYRYVFGIFLIYPLSALITLLALGLGFGMWWQAVLWILLWPLTCKFGWWYYKTLRDLKAKCNALCRKEKVREAVAVRQCISSMMTSK